MAKHKGSPVARKNKKGKASKKKLNKAAEKAFFGTRSS